MQGDALGTQDVRDPSLRRWSYAASRIETLAGGGVASAVVAQDVDTNYSAAALGGK